MASEKQARMRGVDDVHWTITLDYLLSRRMLAPLSPKSVLLGSVKTE